MPIGHCFLPRLLSKKSKMPDPESRSESGVTGCQKVPKVVKVLRAFYGLHLPKKRGFTYCRLRHAQSRISRSSRQALQCCGLSQLLGGCHESFDHDFSALHCDVRFDHGSDLIRNYPTNQYYTPKNARTQSQYTKQM